MTQIGRMEGIQALTLTLLPEGEGTQKKGWFGGLWQDTDFAKFWVSRTVSNFGILMGALQFVAVLVLGATPFQMGVLVALGVAPSIVIGFFAGVRGPHSAAAHPHRIRAWQVRADGVHSRRVPDWAVAHRAAICRGVL